MPRFAENSLAKCDGILINIHSIRAATQLPHTTYTSPSRRSICGAFKSEIPRLSMTVLPPDWFIAACICKSKWKADTDGPSGWLPEVIVYGAHLRASHRVVFWFLLFYSHSTAFCQTFVATSDGNNSNMFKRSIMMWYILLFFLAPKGKRGGGDEEEEYRFIFIRIKNTYKINQKLSAHAVKSCGQ